MKSSSDSWRSIVLEAVVAFVVAGLFVASCVLIRVYPLDRLGQIAGLAGLGFRFVIMALLLVVALIVAARARGGRGFDLTSRLACAAIAGLATGIVGGGILVALRGTPWGLNGQGGDVGALASWAVSLQHGAKIPALYPPLPLHVLARYSDLVGLTPDLAMKHLQIIGTAAFGPVAYVSWRLLLKAPWALAIGVIASLPLIEPYKPYPNLVLVVFVPLAIHFLGVLREIAGRSLEQIARWGVAFGLVFGVLCISYSGWFQWAAPGLLVATLVVFPWREGRRNGVWLLAITGAVFMLIAGHYLLGLVLDPSTKVVDNYVYFDVKTEPMYIAMWRNDTPGIVGAWPPIGELGGVGLFTIALAIGLGLAIAVARKTTFVITCGALLAGSWLLRFLYARKLWDTKLVQLYPRTTPLILYCLLVLAGYAIYRLGQRVAADSPMRGASGLIGAVCALLLFFGSAGTALSDRYMPLDSDPPGPGWLAYNAHRTKWGLKPILKVRPLHWNRHLRSP